MNKNGFTLLELLAVIVILAIVVLIITPVVSSIILSARKTAFKRSVEGVLESANYYKVNADFNKTMEYPTVFTCDGEKCVDGNGNELEFNGATPKRGYVVINTTGIIEANNLCDSNFCASGTKENLTLSDGDATVICVIGQVWNFPYLDETNENRVHTYNVPCNGTYKVELWGAQGGDANSGQGGLGAYTSGYINLNESRNLYIYVGSKPTLSIDSYNGGGNTNNSHYPTADGGGATDIRLVNGSWDNFDSLKSRIMVAAGGGGAQGYVGGTAGGDAGGLYGYEGTYSGTLVSPSSIPTGGTQNSPGIGDTANYTGSDGGFGYGGDGNLAYGGGAGGSGYYGGGGGGNLEHVSSGGGGSSFISGYTGCNAIAGSSTSSSIVHTNTATHDSTLTFTNANMIDGKGCDWSTGVATDCGPNQPQPDGTDAIGHTGNGYARIIYIGQ